MRVAILVDDNTVIVDQTVRTVDCSPLVAEDIHAVQWDDVEGFGEIEHRMTFDRTRSALHVRSRKPNESIADFGPYQSYLDAWRAEDAKHKAEELRAAKAVAELPELYPPPPLYPPRAPPPLTSEPKD